MKKYIRTIIIVTIVIAVSSQGRLAAVYGDTALFHEKLGPLLTNAIQRASGSQVPGTMSAGGDDSGESTSAELQKTIVVMDADAFESLPPDLLASLQEKVESLGGRVGEHAFNNVQVWLPLYAVEALARWEAVKNIKLPFAPKTMQTVSEGVSVIHADRFPSSGPDGTGVKVGVVDVGFYGYSDLLGLELPPKVQTKVASASEFLSTRHGAACAEILHDVAPGAAMYLANAGDVEVDFPNAVSWLKNNGVSVVSSSIGLNLFFRLVYIHEILNSAGTFEANYFESQMEIFNQIVDQYNFTVSEAVSDGMVWSQAAGNDGRKKWSGMFADTDGDGFLNFSADENYNEIDVSLAGFGDEMYVALMWGEGESHRTTDDFDLYVLNSSGSVSCSSIFDQKRTEFGVEVCRMYVDWRSTYLVVVENYDAEPQNLEILLGYENFPEFKHYVQSGTVDLTVPSYNENAITVGAVPFNDPADVQTYSSHGPSADGVVKPDLVAPDEVSTESYGALAFAGTSAAAPHVAGAAALVKQVHSDWSPSRIKQYLEDTAMDLGESGKDNESGSGLVDLEALATHTEPASVHRLYFPYIACDDRWNSEITVIHTGREGETTGRFYAYDSQSALVSTHSPAPLAPNEVLRLDVDSAFENADAIGYVVFESDSEKFEGFAKVYVPGERRGSYPAAKEAASGDIAVAQIASDNRWETAFFLVNTTGNEKNVSIVFSDGRTVSKSLGPSAQARFLVRELFGGVAQPGIGSAVFKNADGLTVAQTFTDTSKKAMCAVLLSDSSPSRLYFAHLPGVDGWSGGVSLYNPSQRRSNLAFRSYDAAGTLLSPVKKGVLGPGRKYSASFQNLRLPENAAWLSIESDNVVEGVEIFSNGNMLAGDRVSGNVFTKGLLAPVETDGVTGLVLVNTANFAAEVVLECRDEAGALVARESLAMSAREKKSGTAQAFFSEGIGGCATVFYTSDRNLAGFRLNASSDGAMLDALPALPATP